MDNNKTQKRGIDDVVVRVDKETAEQIELLSKQMGSNIKETTRWVIWLARKCMGRKVLIEDGEEILEISLKEFEKLTELDNKRVGKA